jgi:hypothetical protein
MPSMPGSSLQERLFELWIASPYREQNSFRFGFSVPLAEGSFGFRLFVYPSTGKHATFFGNFINYMGLPHAWKPGQVVTALPINGWQTPLAQAALPKLYIAWVDLATQLGELYPWQVTVDPHHRCPLEKLLIP